MNIRNRIVEFRKVRLGELRPHPLNWRTHSTEQADALRGILAEVGFAGVPLTRLMPDGSLQLLDGHLRAETTPDAEVTVAVTDLTDPEAAKVLATYDTLGGMAGVDDAKLGELLKQVETESPAIEAMLAELAQDAGLAEELPDPGGGDDEFDATPDDGPTRCNPGDLWVIGGKHRVIIGDNTDPEVVARLMAGEQCGLCFTSPPYAQQRDYGDAAKEKVQDWHALMCGTFANLPMTDDGQVLVNLGLIHRDGEWVPYWDQWIEWMRQQGWRRFGWYVWDQGSGLPGDWNGRLAPSFEFLWHFNREATRPEKWIKTTDACRSTKGKPALPVGFNKQGGSKSFSSPDKQGQDFKIPDSVIRVNRSPIDGRNHPASFPVALPTFVLESWPASVYDPFLGSGTTLIAAHRLNRVCYGCEIEPKYGDVILKRAEAEGLTCVLSS